MPEGSGGPGLGGIGAPIEPGGGAGGIGCEPGGAGGRGGLSRGGSEVEWQLHEPRPGALVQWAKTTGGTPSLPDT